MTSNTPTSPIRAVASKPTRTTSSISLAWPPKTWAPSRPIPQLSKEANIYPGSCTYAVMFHQLKEPFTDPKVREAFAYALDREAWVKDVLKGLGSPTLTWIPKGFPGYEEAENRWGFRSRGGQAGAGRIHLRLVDKLPEITLTFSDTPRNRTR